MKNKWPYQTQFYVLEYMPMKTELSKFINLNKQMK